MKVRATEEQEITDGCGRKRRILKFLVDERVLKNLWGKRERRSDGVR